MSFFKKLFNRIGGKGEEAPAPEAEKTATSVVEETLPPGEASAPEPEATARGPLFGEQLQPGRPAGWSVIRLSGRIQLTVRPAIVARGSAAADGQAAL